MKRSNIIGIIAAAVVIIVSVVLISWYLRRSTPTLIQGTVECTTYKASSKVPGRIDDMKVEQGDRVEKGQLLYTLSTPELEAKLRQAEAVKSAAAALDQAAIAGARKEDKEAAAARVRQAEGAVSEVESYISDAMVYSPVTGEVSTIIAEQGELVGSGYPVVAILDMSDMWVTFNIKETLLPAIRVGTRMSGYVPALGYDVEFEVTYIAVQADFATWSATRTQGGFDIRTFAVKAKPTTHIENMRPGMSVLVDWDLIGK